MKRCAFCHDGEEVTRIQAYDAWPLVADEHMPFMVDAWMQACDDCAALHDLGEPRP